MPSEWETNPAVTDGPQPWGFRGVWCVTGAASDSRDFGCSWEGVTAAPLELLGAVGVPDLQELHWLGMGELKGARLWLMGEGRAVPRQAVGWGHPHGFV